MYKFVVILYIHIQFSIFTPGINVYRMGHRLYAASHFAVIRDGCPGSHRDIETDIVPSVVDFKQIALAGLEGEPVDFYA